MQQGCLSIRLPLARWITPAPSITSNQTNISPHISFNLELVRCKSHFIHSRAQPLGYLFTLDLWQLELSSRWTPHTPRNSPPCLSATLPRHTSPCFSMLLCHALRQLSRASSKIAVSISTITITLDRIRILPSLNVRISSHTPAALVAPTPKWAPLPRRPNQPAPISH